MSRHDDHIEELLDGLCDCMNYHVCEWHERLRRGDCRRTLIADLEAELNERHYRYCVENDIIEADSEDA